MLSGLKNNSATRGLGDPWSKLGNSLGGHEGRTPSYRCCEPGSGAVAALSSSWGRSRAWSQLFWERATIALAKRGTVRMSLS